MQVPKSHRGFKHERRLACIAAMLAVGLTAVAFHATSRDAIPTTTVAKIDSAPIRTNSPEPAQNKPESTPIPSATEPPPVTPDSPETTTASEPETATNRQESNLAATPTADDPTGIKAFDAMAAADPITKIVTEPVRQSRTWADITGKFKVDAYLVSKNKLDVELERVDNGKRVNIPVAKLSSDDRKWLREYERQSKATETKQINPSASLLVGKVVRVMDGDTLLLVDGAGKETTIRFNGIDAPEKDQRFGRESGEWLGDQIGQQSIRAEVTDKDRYGRSLADVYVGDRWLNHELVLAGLAWHYVQYSDDVRLATAQNEARSKRLGLWQDARKVAPWDWRNGQRVETALPANVPSTRETDTIVYISPTGTKYHREHCRTVKGEHTAMPLSRAASAYEPCGVCKP